ncbi:MAG: MATE family efflux transporter [Ruminococcaceae bacterium]|nr:MATE family efflux transporter [Oscillospiraceae bacterium]
MNLKKYVGNRAFYRKVLAVAVPMMIQNGITNLVNLLDNIMVGRLGTEPMSGVSIVNQFIFVFNLLIFGAVSAAGIFTAQYHGNKDTDGVRHTFRFKLLINLAAAILAIVSFAALDDRLISLFLHAGSAEGDLALTLSYGKQYLLIMLFGLLPYAISQVYASTMRETEQTLVPMAASVVAVGVNFILNLILIFGIPGILPAMGVRGAAIATVISRFAELAVLVAWGHTHKSRCPYLVGAYRSLRVPRALFGRIIAKGLPLMANEVLWAMAITLRNQCYSTRGLDIVAAQNISSTIVNVFNVVYMAIGSSIAIIVGNLLGAGRFDEARDADRKMLAFSVTCSAGIGLLLVASAPFFPMLYKTGDDVRALATYMMLISAATMPFCAYAHSAYFTLRSGGQVMVTILFDSAYMWCLVLPVSAILAYLTPMSIHLLFAICQGTELVKVFFGYLLLRRGTWVRRLVSEGEK